MKYFAVVFLIIGLGLMGCEEKLSTSDNEEVVNSKELVFDDTEQRGDWVVRHTQNGEYNMATRSSLRVVHDKNGALETTYQKYLAELTKAERENKVTKGEQGVLRYDFGVTQAMLLPADLAPTAAREPILIFCTNWKKTRMSKSGGGCSAIYELYPNLKVNFRPFEQSFSEEDVANLDHFLNLEREARKAAIQFLKDNPNFYPF